MKLNFRPWAPSLTAFGAWLQGQSTQSAKSWSIRLRSKDRDKAEAAVTEALAWDFIACRCDSTRLAEVPGTGGVDFEFTSNDKTFLVEATNISIASASDATGMPDGQPFAGFHRLLTDRLRQKVRGKLDQARQHSAHPVLVFVTTLHENASAVCFCRLAVEFAMGSPPRITGRLNPHTGEVEGELYDSTDLTRSVFLSPHPILGADGNQVAQAKYQPISGLLVGGFGLRPSNVRVLGGLNPEATRPFDPSILPDVPFCSFREWPVTDRIGFHWTTTEEAEELRERRLAENRLRAAGHGWLLDQIADEINPLPG